MMNITNTTIPVLSGQNNETQIIPIFTILGCSLGSGAIVASCVATKGNLGPRVVQTVCGIGSAACLLTNMFIEGHSAGLEDRNTSESQVHGLLCALGACVPLCVGVIGFIRARLICTNEHRQRVMRDETSELPRRDSLGLNIEMENIRLPTYEEALTENQSVVAEDSEIERLSDYADIAPEGDPPPPYDTSQPPPPKYRSNQSLNQTR